MTCRASGTGSTSRKEHSTRRTKPPYLCNAVQGLPEPACMWDVGWPGSASSSTCVDQGHSDGMPSFLMGQRYCRYQMPHLCVHDNHLPELLSSNFCALQCLPHQNASARSGQAARLQCPKLLPAEESEEEESSSEDDAPLVKRKAAAKPVARKPAGGMSCQMHPVLMVPPGMHAKLQSKPELRSPRGCGAVHQCAGHS